MATLPQFQSNDRDFQLMQSGWSSKLNPLLANPSLQSSILKQVSLVSGVNTINHLLGRKLQGWRIVRKRAASEVYDDQDNNPNPQLTLVLISNASVVVDLEVF